MPDSLAVLRVNVLCVLGRATKLRVNHAVTASRSTTTSCLSEASNHVARSSPPGSRTHPNLSVELGFR